MLRFTTLKKERGVQITKRHVIAKFSFFADNIGLINY